MWSYPDWDMFQSDHPWGAYQAAARAISGSLIYFADDFNKLDKNIISKLALPNGKVLLCEDIALPCREYLFTNPAKPNRALKLFNHNKYNSVLGIFNVMLKNDTSVIYSPSNVKGLNENAKFAVFSGQSQMLTKLSFNETLTLSLMVKGFDVITISEILKGCAPIGLLDKYNPGGIFSKILIEEHKISIDLKFGGTIGFYCEKKPIKVLYENGNEEITFIYDPSTNFLKIMVPDAENQSITLMFE